MKKKKLKRSKLVSFVVLLLLIIGASYFIGNYFYDLKVGGSTELKVVYDDTDYYLLENKNYMTDEEALLTYPYHFTIQNLGSKKAIYRVKLTDDTKNLIKRDDLKYTLKLSSEVIASGNLKEIKDDVLYEGNIDGSKKQDFYFYLWIGSEKFNGTGDYKCYLKLESYDSYGPGFN